MNEVKHIVCCAFGAAGSVLSCFFGGVDQLLVTLAVFMAIDYVSGIIAAGVFHASKKSRGGGLNSAAGFKGLLKKIFMLVLVGVAHMLDLSLGVDFVRAGVVVGFLANETISIVENAGLMGIPMPAAIKKAIDILTKTEG